MEAKAIIIFSMQRCTLSAVAGSTGLEMAFRSNIVLESRYGKSLPVWAKKVSSRQITSLPGGRWNGFTKPFARHSVPWRIGLASGGGDGGFEIVNVRLRLESAPEWISLVASMIVLKNDALDVGPMRVLVQYLDAS
jgi:hypothetical protein